MILIKLIVKNDSELLEYLLKNLDGSIKSIKKKLKNGLIYVDGVKTLKYDYPLKKGSVILITSFNSNVVPFDILYEDNNIIVISKPSGLLTVATSKEKELTAYHFVREYLRTKNKSAKVFVIHRLDKDTSGVLMFAKDEYSKKVFQEKWNEIVKTRQYVAVVSGILDKKSDRLVNYLAETKTNYVYVTNKQKGKLCITNYKVLKEKNNKSLLEISIETGRKNQIRVQLSNINHPILGDKKYGDDNYKRLFLHASKLSIYNPITRKNMTFNSERPDDFSKII